MELSIIITLILLGLGLIVVEIIFIPGTTVIGFFGFAMMVTGAVMSFRYYGSEVGWITVGCSMVASGLVLYFSFKSKVWNRFALRSTMHSTVNEGELKDLALGQEGVALSALRPVGKGEWNFKSYEVKTQGEYVERGTKIRIIKISLNQIIVEPTT
jgi:membrane-bound ClpP family serine protease